jgi:ribosomal protein S18 acetylase RimI-like enzyme
MDATRTAAVTLLLPSDLVAFAQCTALDAEVFGYASIPLGVSSKARTWIARANDEARAVVGFLAEGGPSFCVYIQGIAVAAARRRAGVGRALLRACVARASERGMSHVVLHVGTSNHAAVALYRSEGFDVRARLPDFYREGLYEERSAYEMVIALG